MLFYAMAIAFFGGEATEAILVQNHRNERNLNCFYRKTTKRRNSHGHFKYIKKHKIKPRNCCSAVITLYSPKYLLVINCPCSTVLSHSRTVKLYQEKTITMIWIFVTPMSSVWHYSTQFFWHCVLVRYSHWTNIMQYGKSLYPASLITLLLLLLS